MNQKETKDHYKIVADTDYLKEAPTKDYYILTLTPEFFETEPGKTFDVYLTLDVGGDYGFVGLEHTFKFEFAELSASNVNLFYAYDIETGVYTYKYWDKRTRFNNEVYNELGQVVGFATN